MTPCPVCGWTWVPDSWKWRTRKPKPKKPKPSAPRETDAS